jgi:PTH1 family peptidyl-tRNA hydrolase
VENWYLIVGLGNPGQKYRRTRHNAGFMVADRFAERRGRRWTEAAKFQACVARGEFESCAVILAKPQTFMNLSGAAVQGLAAYYRVPAARTLIVVDDADLPFGEIRMRGSGSSGGHHGLESIEQHLGTRDYPRVRVGIGRTKDGVREITGHVLGRFDPGEERLLEQILERVCQQIECWLKAGIGKAMSEFNGMINPPRVNES